MEQSSDRSAEKGARPIGPERLEALALRYVGRYATTRAKLAGYLRRKVETAGWGGDRPPDIAGLVGKFADLGYLDDRAFAQAKAASLTRRGYGARRIGMALRAAGVEEEDRADAVEDARDGALDAALALARRRRIGPFATVPPDRAARERAIAILVRAGHDVSMARQIMEMTLDRVESADFHL